jgi:hypothetical protein
MCKILPSSVVVLIALWLSSDALSLEVPLKEDKPHALWGFFFHRYAAPYSYSGAFQIGGAQYTIKIIDFNRNGKITDRAKITFVHNLSNRTLIYPTGDIVYLSDGGKTDYSDGLILGDLLLLGGTLFEVRIDSANRKMILNEIKDGLSPLKLSIKTERLSLISEDGSRCLMAYKPAGDVIMLPAGKYRLLEYQALRRDLQGDIWRLQAQGTFESSPITVGQGGEAVLTFGEPFAPIVTPIPINNGTLTGKGVIRLNFAVEGSGKEILTDLRRIKGTGALITLSKAKFRGNRPKEPSYTIVKSNGEIVAQGTFEYG